VGVVRVCVCGVFCVFGVGGDFLFWGGGELSELKGKRGKSGKELLLISPQHSSHALEAATCSKWDPG